MVDGPSSISQNRARSVCRSAVVMWSECVPDCVGGLHPITQPKRVFCKHNSVSMDCGILICPTHNDANVGPELNNISIGLGMWNVGSANFRFLGIWRADRSIGWSGTADDIVGITKNVAVRSYLPSIETMVAVSWLLAMVVKSSRAPIATEHLFRFIPREFANFSVIKFILEPVFSSALARIGDALVEGGREWVIVVVVGPGPLQLSLGAVDVAAGVLLIFPPFFGAWE